MSEKIPLGVVRNEADWVDFLTASDDPLVVQAALSLADEADVGFSPPLLADLAWRPGGLWQGPDVGGEGPLDGDSLKATTDALLEALTADDPDISSDMLFPLAEEWGQCLFALGDLESAAALYEALSIAYEQGGDRDNGVRALILARYASGDIEAIDRMAAEIPPGSRLADLAELTREELAPVIRQMERLQFLSGHFAAIDLMERQVKEHLLFCASSAVPNWTTSPEEVAQEREAYLNSLMTLSIAFAEMRERLADGTFDSLESAFHAFGSYTALFDVDGARLDRYGLSAYLRRYGIDLEAVFALSRLSHSEDRACGTLDYIRDLRDGRLGAFDPLVTDYPHQTITHHLQDLSYGAAPDVGREAALLLDKVRGYGSVSGFTDLEWAHLVREGEKEAILIGASGLVALPFGAYATATAAGLKIMRAGRVVWTGTEAGEAVLGARAAGFAVEGAMFFATHDVLHASVVGGGDYFTPQGLAKTYLALGVLRGVMRLWRVSGGAALRAMAHETPDVAPYAKLLDKGGALTAEGSGFFGLGYGEELLHLVPPSEHTAIQRLILAGVQLAQLRVAFAAGGRVSAHFAAIKTIEFELNTATVWLDKTEAAGGLSKDVAFKVHLRILALERQLTELLGMPEPVATGDGLQALLHGPLLAVGRSGQGRGARGGSGRADPNYVIPIALGRNYNWDAENPDLAALSQITAAMAEAMDGLNIRFNTEQVRRQPFIIDGVEMKGQKVLYYLLYALWLSRGGARIGAGAVLKEPGYGYADAIRYVTDEVLKRAAPVVKVDFELAAGKGYLWLTDRPNQVVLEAILKEIHACFQGAGFTFNVSNLYRRTYLIDGRPVFGGALLNHYCLARYLAAFPHNPQRLSVNDAWREPNFSYANAIDDFLSRVMQVKLTSDAAYVLSVGEDYGWSTTAPDCAMLEQILTNIAVLFRQAGVPFIARSIRDSEFRYPSGGKRSIKGDRILHHYAFSLWLAAHRGENPIALKDAAEVEGYHFSQILARFEAKVLAPPLHFSDMDPDALLRWATEHRLDPVLSLFQDDPAALIEALSFLEGQALAGRDAVDFVNAYVGLRAGSGRNGNGRDESIDSRARRTRYMAAQAEAIAQGRSADLSDEMLARELVLLITLSRPEFESAPDALIADLSAQARTAPHLFLKLLYAQAAQYFTRFNHMEVLGMRIKPYGYEREGVHFLMTHRRAILADETGMGKSYQTIGAVETLGIRRTLWVTTASNKGALRDEILSVSYTPREAIEVLASEPLERAVQMQTVGNKRYVIVNYELLAQFYRDAPVEYEKFVSGFDLAVIDEAQRIDNPDSLRSRAIRSIKAERLWLLTASPYQNRPEGFWPLLNFLYPDRFPDWGDFKARYTRSAADVLRLNRDLRDIMLRRTKLNTLSFFHRDTPYADQLADDVPRMPHHVRIPASEEGRYSLTPAQAELTARMIGDFEGWAREFNANLPAGAKPINLATVNPLLKFTLLYRVIYTPEYFGLPGENPMLAALDQAVTGRLARGEKLILWCWNRDVIDLLVKRYENYGVRRIDREVTGVQRDNARLDFQNRGDVRLLVANFSSGGAGLTLTAANAGIYVQLPLVFPALYQADGRNQRLIGLEQVHHAKASVESLWLTPQFPEGFSESYSDAFVSGILSHGTLVEQGERRLEGGELEYRLSMEGYRDPAALDAAFRLGLMRGLGLLPNGQGTASPPPELFIPLTEEGETAAE